VAKKNNNLIPIFLLGLVCFLLQSPFFSSPAYSTEAVDPPPQKSLDYTEDPSVQERKQAVQEALQGVESLTWVMIKMLFILLMVCLFAFFLLRWLLPRLGSPLLGKGSMIQVIHRYTLEPKKSLYIIRVDESFHLIGASDQSINYLTALPEESMEKMLKEIESNSLARNRNKSFLDFLNLHHKKPLKKSFSQKTGEGE